MVDNRFQEKQKDREIKRLEQKLSSLSHFLLGVFQKGYMDEMEGVKILKEVGVMFDEENRSTRLLLTFE